MKSLREGFAVQDLLVVDGALGLGWEDVQLVPHDPSWSEMYLRERRRIWSACRDLSVEIEHVGSTAVRGLAAKPILDLLVGTRSSDEVREVDRRLRLLDYRPATERERCDRAFLWRGDSHERSTHHVNVTLIESETWCRLINFRDLLRVDNALRARYQDLKLELAETCGREGYTTSKAAFIRDALGRDI